MVIKTELLLDMTESDQWKWGGRMGRENKNKGLLNRFYLSLFQV